MPDFKGRRDGDKRITVVTGHYGSGKTEFSVSLAMMLAKEGYGPYKRLALIDLDIANPYFRSRERRNSLERAGISVYGSHYDHEITAELPALGANIRTPLEDKDCRVIVDVGGNDAGAIVLNQFTKYFTDEESTRLIVVNANRPETRSVEGVLEHLNAIEWKTGLCMDAIVNNCHLLRETDEGCIEKGYDLCSRVCDATGKFIWCNCFPQGIVDGEALQKKYDHLMPLGLYMRPSWLDR